jgi:hypothetical protein
VGKASSAKKVARAARAGGNRRPGQRRNLGFPILIAAVVVIGVSLVLFARSSREATAAPRSQANEESDHWHASLGIYQCDRFLFDGTPEGGPFFTDRPDASGQTDRQGIHTHDDGVIHIHPFLDSAGGRNARMRIFFENIGLEWSDSQITFPDGTVWDEGETTCTVDGEEVPGQIVLARWNSAQDAADGERPSELVTEDFGDVRFRADREYYTLAFLPEGELEDIPVRPDIIESLNNLSDVIEAPGESTTTTEPATSDSSTTSTSAPAGSTTSTTAAP